MREYIKNVANLLEKFIYEGCKSIIDVGSSGIAAELGVMMPRKVSADVGTPVITDGVSRVVSDFCDYPLGEWYDIVFCSQALEYIEDVETFVAKLFDLAKKYVIVAVPYKQDSNSIERPVHTCIDDERVKSWTKSNPTGRWVISDDAGAEWLLHVYRVPGDRCGGGVAGSTTIVTRIRNRNSIFADTLKNWLQFDVPIIVVDWRDDGCEFAWDVVKPFGSPLVKVLETKYEYCFLPSHSWNLGISQVETEYVLCVDVDNILRPHFFEVNVPSGSAFINGINVSSLVGTHLTKKERIDVVGGYNENMITMGYQDIDLYNRLHKVGCRSCSFVKDSIRHKQHSRNMTIISYFQDARHLSEDGDRKVWSKMADLNTTIGHKLTWWADSNRVAYDLTQMEPNRTLAVRKFNRGDE